MLRYRLYLEPDTNDTILVTSPDLPLVTYGKDEAEALRNAADAANAVLESMMDAREDVPEGRAKVAGPSLQISLQTELKLRLHQAMRAAGMTRADLMRRLGWQRESVDRLFRLEHNSRIEQLEQAFAAVGKAVSVVVMEAA